MIKIHRSKIFFILIVFLILLPGCGAVPFPGGEGSGSQVLESRLTRVQNPEVPEADLQTLTAGNTALALDLYQEIKSREGNLFYSPYSISTALAMTYAGARGSTADQMAAGLHFDLPLERLHPAFNVLDQALLSRAEVEVPDESGDPFQLRTANALWGQQNFHFEQDFLDLLAENYGAGLRLLDFMTAPEESRQQVNQWVEDQTEDRIKVLIPQGGIDQNTRLVLSNAIYFKAGWREPFQEDLTEEGSFTTLDGSEVQVPFMKQGSSETYPYLDGEGFQAVELPYVGGEVALLVIMPDEGQFQAFEDSLTPEKLQQITAGLDSQAVDLRLPKFEFEHQISLADTLAGMGMPDPFSGQADFSGMTGSKELFISDVFHKAFVSLDEQGTEAAAATAVVMKLTSMPASPIELSVDRPFLFLIRDRVTGTVLFIGRVVNPA